MDAEMREAGLVRQIQNAKTSDELETWKTDARATNAAEGLDQAAKNRVNREYKARLASLLSLELGMP